MDATIHYDNEAPLEALARKRVAVLGYGSQGRAHALNLSDSGLDVVVGAREDSPSERAARTDGLSVTTLAEDPIRALSSRMVQTKNPNDREDLEPQNFPILLAGSMIATLLAVLALILAQRAFFARTVEDW